MSKLINAALDLAAVTTTSYFAFSAAAVLCSLVGCREHVSLVLGGMVGLTVLAAGLLVGMRTEAE